MKKILAFALPLLMVSAGFAQTRPTGGATGGGTAGGSGGLTNFGSSGFGATGGTTGGLTSGGMTTGATGGVGGTGGFGQGFTFNSGLGVGASPMGTGGMGGMTGRSGFGGTGGMMGMGGMGMGGMGMGGMGMGGMGMGGMGGGRGGAGGMGGTQQQYQIRPTVKLGFEVARPTGQQRTQQFVSTIARLPQPQRFAGISVKVDGRTAIATGKLVNTADANLLKNLLLMEPGIYEVDISALTGEKSTASPSDRPAESVPAVPVPQ